MGISNPSTSTVSHNIYTQSSNSTGNGVNVFTGSSPPASSFYSPENGTDFYVTEDGLDNYVTES